MRRTKILATLGPASTTPGTIRRLIEAGADGFRVNCSHGDSAEHRRTIAQVRAAARRCGRPVFVVADLQGPKMRLGELRPSPTVLRTGAQWILDQDTAPGDAHRVSVQIPGFREAARRGDPILLGDGEVELRVRSVGPDRLTAEVVQGGSVASHAGIYLPRAKLRRSILSPKDRDDLRLALDEGVDYVALSFVRRREDLREAKQCAAGLAPDNSVGWIAKIERGEALDRIEGILEESDAIMVARGDLGIEVPLERLALEQKRLIDVARAAGKPSIVATQMLLSMVHAPRPSRAEATDVANAVLDGADALMLSEESAIGEHPVDSVAWLDRIAKATEAEGTIPPIRRARVARTEVSDERSVADAAVRLASDLGAAAIVTPTHSGRTARWVSSARPSAPIVALSSSPATVARLGLVWGVMPRRATAHLDLLALREWAVRVVDGIPEIPRGRPIVLTVGYPVEGRPTNLVTVVDRRRRAPGRPPGKN